MNKKFRSRYLFLILAVFIFLASFNVGVIGASMEKQDLKLSYMKGEGAGEQYGINTIENGPDGISSVGFIDSKNGNLNLYLGTNVGVQVFENDSSNYLTKMKGIDGKVLAIGGSDEDNLVAVVENKLVNGMTISFEHYLYDYSPADKTWIKNEKSYFGDMNNYKNMADNSPVVIIDKDNIWLDSLNWNGKTWSKNKITFIDIYKSNNGEVFGLTNNGKIYKYADKSWIDINAKKLPKSNDYLTINGDKKGNLIIKVRIQSEIEFYKLDKGLVSKLDKLPDNTASIEFDSRGNTYAFAKGKHYKETSSGGYWSTNVYRFDKDKWILQTIDAFNDMNEDDNPDNKIRPDGVNKILTPIDGVDVFIGTAGANYISTKDYKLTFNSNNGEEIVEVVKQGRNEISPDLPKKKGYTFKGWYLDREFKVEYDFRTFPVKDINLYAKWEKTLEDKSKNDRQQALASLKENLEKANQNDFESENWNRLKAIYDIGNYKINIASDPRAIYDGLNKAVDKMGQVPVSVERDITIYVSMEKFTLGEGYIIEPVMLEVKNYEQASKVIVDLLQKQYPKVDKPWEMTGRVDSDFYLSRVYDPSNNKPNIPDYILKKVDINYNAKTENWLGEFDYYYMSGWMYSINNKFPGVGAASYRLSDGDVMRWQFTLYGYGADLAVDNSAWGTESIVKVGDKTQLTKEIAILNTSKAKDKLNKDKNYIGAMKVLQNPRVEQKVIDKAVLDLKNIK